jgi:HAD superfamily hydrolase (TIGR01490 family)
VALAIFDLDNTLLAGDSDHAWGQFLVDRRIVDAAHFKQANDRFFEDYQSGRLDITAYLEFALRPLTEHPLEQLHTWREQFVEDCIRPLILAKGRSLIEQHRAQGDELLIITATNRFVTEPIAGVLGIHHLIATEPEFLNGRYSGRIAGTPSFREGKITRLVQWLEEQQRDLSGATFYSDSHNDLPLLERVDHPVAVDPDSVLRRHAERRNWPIISLRN